MKFNLFKIVKIAIFTAALTTFVEGHAMSFIDHVQVNESTLKCNPRSKIPQVVEAINNSVNGDLGKITKIDFRDNDIQSEQLKELIPFLLELPKVEYISFRNNRITGDIFERDDETNLINPFLTLLWRKSLKYMDISINYLSLDNLIPLADRLYQIARDRTPRGERIDRLFAPAQQRLYEKLIFLPGIPSDDILLPMESRKSHEDYYTTYFKDR